MVIEESVNLPVNHLMNPNVVSVEHDTTLKEVSELMTKQKIFFISTWMSYSSQYFAL